MNEETLNLMIEYQKSLLKRIADLETELNTKSAFRKLNKAMEKNTSRQKDVDYMMELFARYEENTKDAIRDYLKSYADFTDEYRLLSVFIR